MSTKRPAPAPTEKPRREAYPLSTGQTDHLAQQAVEAHKLPPDDAAPAAKET